MKRIFFVLNFFLIFSAWGQTLKTTVNQVLSSPCFRYSSFSMYVVDLENDSVIYARNENLILKPASTLKILTTIAALEVLGGDYRFNTQIMYDGFIDTAARTLRGNLYIKGGGDPTLGSRFFPVTDNKRFLEDWVSAVKALGIDTVQGKVIADATVYGWQTVPGKWSWEDLGNYYGAGANGLTIYDNTYFLHFRTGTYSGARTYITKITPEIPGLKVKNYVRTANIRSDQAYIYGAPYTYERIVKGRLPRYKKDFKVKGSMPDPALFAAYEFYNALKAANVVVKDTFSTIRLLEDSSYLTSGKTRIFTFYSVPVAKIVEKTNTKSINLFAEHLLREISLKLKGTADVDSAPEALKKFWAEKGMDVSNMQIYDGSGLSAYNGLSVKHLVFALKYVSGTKNFDVFKNSLAVAGEKGTLKYYCRETQAAGKIFAKTGTLSKCKAFAGYAYTLSGKTLVFAIIVNNYACRSRYAKKYFEKLLCALVNVK